MTDPLSDAERREALKDVDRLRGEVTRIASVSARDFDGVRPTTAVWYAEQNALSALERFRQAVAGAFEWDSDRRKTA